MIDNLAVRQILDDSNVLLLDMNGTFMFGEDRFGPAFDYAATYRELGGKILEPPALMAIVDGCYATMAAMYEDPAREDDFTQVREVLEAAAVVKGLASGEVDLIEEVMACHELGCITKPYADMLHQLAGRFELGIIGNLWSKKDRWLQALDAAGVLKLFKGRIVISSDTTSMKPSRRLFEKAISLFDYDVEQMAYIGDSFRCDVQGARRVGMRSIWIQGGQGDVSGVEARVNDLLELGAFLSDT